MEKIGKKNILIDILWAMTLYMPLSTTVELLNNFDRIQPHQKIYATLSLIIFMISALIYSLKRRVPM